MTLVLLPANKGDPEVRQWMAAHYSAPKGFVGRQLLYKVTFDGVTYGAIAAGSATRFLPGRDEFFQASLPLNHVANNTFFHIEKRDGKYPCRNFAPLVVAAMRIRVADDWFVRYGDRVVAWEALVELPRSGELYRRDGWKEVGMTKGFTCKRVGGKGTDSWGGRRVWNTDLEHLRPKRVFVRWASA